jgi:hypothetical protein
LDLDIYHPESESATLDFDPRRSRRSRAEKGENNTIEITAPLKIGVSKDK